jgi:hypothetical protein
MCCNCKGERLSGNGCIHGMDNFCLISKCEDKNFFRKAIIHHCICQQLHTICESSPSCHGGMSFIRESIQRDVYRFKEILYMIRMAWESRNELRDETKIKRNEDCKTPFEQKSLTKRTEEFEMNNSWDENPLQKNNCRKMIASKETKFWYQHSSDVQLHAVMPIYVPVT